MVVHAKASGWPFPLLIGWSGSPGIPATRCCAWLLSDRQQAAGRPLQSRPAGASAAGPAGPVRGGADRQAQGCTNRVSVPVVTTDAGSTLTTLPTVSVSRTFSESNRNSSKPVDTKSPASVTFSM